MNEIILDIEVVPQEIYTEKQQAIIQSKIEKKSGDNKDQNKFCAINPEFGKIICIGIHDSIHGYYFITNTTESNLLKIFWDYIDSMTTKEFKIITFNGKSFDIPYLIKRSAILNILNTMKLPHKRYDIYHHFDVYEVLSNFNTWNQVFTLKEYCEIFGIQNDDTHEGKDVFELYKNNNFEEIKKHCQYDIEQTKALYQKIKRFYL